MLRRHFINISCSNDIKPNEIWYKTSNNEKIEYDVLVDCLQGLGYGFVNFLVANVQVNDGWWCLRFAKNLNSIGVTTTANQVETVLDGTTDKLGMTETNIFNVTEIKLPNIFLIGGNAFACCENLQSITIPDSVTSIGNSAFNSCDSLTSIVIPDSVTSIGNSAFNSCHALTSITISNSVTSIGERAFYQCASLTSITIPNSVTSIGDYAFDQCGLTSIIIPNSVTSIGQQAFCNCHFLTSITFDGTIEQWNTVTKGTNWNSQAPATVVHCTDGDVPL